MEALRLERCSHSSTHYTDRQRKILLFLCFHAKPYKTNTTKAKRAKIVNLTDSIKPGKNLITAKGRDNHTI